MRTTSLLLPAAVLLMTVFGCSQGPEKVVKKFLDAQEKRDFKTMKALSTDDSQQMIDVFESVAAKDTSKTQATAMTIKSCTVKDSTAICVYCCNSEGKDDSIHVKKTAEGWKVDMSKETLLGGKAAMDQLIRSSAVPDSVSATQDSLSAAPAGNPGDTGTVVPGH